MDYLYDEETGEPLPYCERCERVFVDDTALDQHTQNSGQHFFCKPCGREFVSRISLKQHWQNSSYHSSTYCRRCELNFIDEEALHDHKSSRTSQHFMCEPCDLDYHTSEDLRQHFIQSSAHQKTYCWKCEKDFENSNNLREVQYLSLSGFQYTD